MIVDMFQERSPTLGVIRLEMWDEGLVLWIGGKIRYRSWRNPLSEDSAIKSSLDEKIHRQLVKSANTIVNSYALLASSDAQLAEEWAELVRAARLFLKKEFDYKNTKE